VSVMPVVFLIDASRKFEKFDVQSICYFRHKPFNRFLIFLVLLWYKIYFTQWPTLAQKWQVLNTPAAHSTKSRGNASKKVDYLPFLLPPLLWNTWDCIRCKTTKTGGVKSKERTWGTGTFSTGLYEALHPLSNFEFSFDHGDHGANAHKIYWKYCFIWNTRQT
jgi:hypothetical protein